MLKNPDPGTIVVPNAFAPSRWAGNLGAVLAPEDNNGYDAVMTSQGWIKVRVSPAASDQHAVIWFLPVELDRW